MCSRYMCLFDFFFFEISWVYLFERMNNRGREIILHTSAFLTKITNWGLPFGSNFGGEGGGGVLRYWGGIPLLPFRATTTNLFLFIFNEPTPAEKAAGFGHVGFGWEREGRTMERREDILVTSILQTRERERGSSYLV